MNEYQKEQLDALRMVAEGLVRLSPAERSELLEKVRAYRAFRKTVDDFLDRHFSQVCTNNCYQNHTSACCSKDGIITFFADTVVNVLHSSPDESDRLAIRLQKVNTGHRCIYLTRQGCMWTVRPVVCAMFLCDKAMDRVFSENAEAQKVWAQLRRQEKRFKWPDRQVLFDELEKVFIALGYRSSLMHLNFSPGLLHVKMKAGLISKPG